MKLKTAICAVLITSSSISLAAGDGPYTFGGILGDPTGVSGKLDLPNDTAIDGAIAWGFGGRSGGRIHGDYLEIRRGQMSAGDADLDLYYGMGARLVSINGGGDSGKIAFGPRAPVGLLYQSEGPNMEFFGEAALILDVIPSVSVDLDLAVGVRLRF